MILFSYISLTTGGLAIAPIITGLSTLWNYKTFADRVKLYAKTINSPEELFQSVNQAAFISIMSLVFYALGGVFEKFSQEWCVIMYGSSIMSLFALEWF